MDGGYTAEDLAASFGDGYEAAIEDIVDFIRDFADDEITAGDVIEHMEYLIAWRLEDGSFDTEEF